MNNTNEFPIQPLNDSVVIELKAKVSILLTDDKNPYNGSDIVHTKVISIGDKVSNISNIKIGDNVIISQHATKHALNIKDNEYDAKKVIASTLKGNHIVGQKETKREIVNYFIVNILDILAIDNQ